MTINSPGSEKFSRHVVEGGDGAGLLDLLSRSRAKAEQRYGVPIKAIVIQEAGLDGFWIHRLLLADGIESHVVDAASIAVNRRHRRAKTDAIDGETLLRTLMAWARGERRVCSMVRAPSPEEEDRRRLTRERGTLLKERIQHTNRVKGLLSGQGVRGYNPLRRLSGSRRCEPATAAGGTILLIGVFQPGSFAVTAQPGSGEAAFSFAGVGRSRRRRSGAKDLLFGPPP